MGKNKKSISLPEKDYLAILDLITRVHGCRTREDIRTCIQNHLLPLFEAQSGLWVWFDFDFASGKMTLSKFIDSVGMDNEPADFIDKFFPYQDSIPKKMAVTSRPVIAHDIDIPREVFQREKDNFFAEHPEYDRNEFPGLNGTRNVLVAVDRPDFNLGLGLHRRIPWDKPWTLRDIRVMELLHPHLVQAIKTLVLNQELMKYNELANALTAAPTAIALLSLDHRVLFRNASFSSLISLNPGHRLPREISLPLEWEAENQGPPYHADSSAIEFPFVKLPQGFFRMVVTLLNSGGEMEDKCWLLRMKPAVEPFSQMNLLMQTHGLTRREMEIATLVRDGIDDREIADRLFISLNTAKNHIKNIHKKMGVHTRGQLVAKLNQKNAG
ncbi:MAG: LuxR C-terminal-related transcriptional regulator [Nitrospinaceae bacterium]